jgi:hypothetical protein
MRRDGKFCFTSFVLICNELIFLSCDDLEARKLNLPFAR